MTTTPSLLVISLCLSSLVSAGVAVYSWRHKDKAGAKMFTAVVIGAAIWSLSYAIALNTFDPQLRQLLELPTWIGRVIMPMAWIIFALQYTGRGDIVTKPFVALLAFNPLVTIGIVLTHPIHELMWRNYHVVEVFGAATAGYGNGVWLVWQTVYGYFLIGTGLLIILEMIVAQGRLYRGQAVALIVAAGIPTMVNIVWLFKLGPYPTLDLTPLAFSVTACMMGYALFRQDLFGLIPATRRTAQRAAIDYFGDGVVVVDDERRIIDINVTAQDIFECEAETVLGKPINGLVPGDSIDLTRGVAQIDIDGRKFELRPTPIRDQQGTEIGKTLIFHDVTERVRRKQLLSVLNRVLRHNLRNDMNVVGGCARTLEDHVDDSGIKLVSRIESRAAKLVELGEKARDIERLIVEEERQRDRFDVCGSVRRIVDQIAVDHPGACITVDAPRERGVETDERIVEVVLSNVIENALEHNDVDRPEIEVTVSVGDEAVEIVVADNGPGIPSQELAVLDAGKETPLEHGSGLGLWLITWSVTALDGQITFEENDPRGTIVRLQLPVSETERAEWNPAVMHTENELSPQRATGMSNGEQFGTGGRHEGESEGEESSGEYASRGSVSPDGN